jgi:predicted metal-binding membrane protein
MGRMTSHIWNGKYTNVPNHQPVIYSFTMFYYYNILTAFLQFMFCSKVYICCRRVRSNFRVSTLGLAWRITEWAAFETPVVMLQHLTTELVDFGSQRAASCGFEESLSLSAEFLVSVVVADWCMSYTTNHLITWVCLKTAFLTPAPNPMFFLLVSHHVTSESDHLSDTVTILGIPVYYGIL